MFLGIDTSCYTTSVAIMAEDGALVADARRPLVVKAGGRGLAQSEMLYQHTRNLPEIFAQALDAAGGRLQLEAVAASVQPRPLAESYMPAFLAGAGYARVLAMSHGVPFRQLSHQENHILAGVWSAGGPSSDRYLAVHVSGGTTEIIEVSVVGQRMAVKLLGGSKDIAAGQLVDRVGVALGLDFPAGARLEELACLGHSSPARLPVSIDGLTVSFSGPESHAHRLLASGHAPAAVAAGVELCIAESLAKLINTASKVAGIHDFLMVGGVTANSFIRRHITECVAKDGVTRLYFPAREYSPDNAVGAAFFALRS